MSSKSLRLKSIFQSLPASYLVLNSDINIVAATDEYYRLTKTTPLDLVGKYLFDVFPENIWTSRASGTLNQLASFKRIQRYKTPHTIPVQRYDIKLPPKEGGKFVKRWWRITNSPVLSARGELMYIVHAVEDITKMIGVLEEAEKEISQKKG